LRKLKENRYCQSQIKSAGRPSPPSRNAFKRKSKGWMKSRRLAAGIAKEGEQENKEYYQNIV